MPIEGVKLLSEDLQAFITGLRPNLKKAIAHKDDLEKHWKDLSKAAKRFSDKLKLVRRYTLMTEATIAEYGVEEKDFELLELLEDDYVRCLLPHMQEELPRLRYLNSWDDLRIRDITEELLETLFLRATQGEFKSKCKICCVIDNLM